MSPRIRSLRTPPILFAHRGGCADAPENTIDAFRLALGNGANGLESDVWLSKDGVPVLVHDELFGRLARRRRISEADVAELPDHIPTLDKLFEAVGTDFDLSLDIKDPSAAQATIDVARAAGLIDRTWLCHPDLETVTSWRQRWSDAKLVHSTGLQRLQLGPERHGAMLYERGIDAVNFRHPDWSGGLIALYHRFNLLCFGWDAQLQRVATELLDMGVDAIFGDHVSRLTAARDQVYG